MARELFSNSGTGITLNERFSTIKPKNQTFFSSRGRSILTPLMTSPSNNQISQNSLNTNMYQLPVQNSIRGSISTRLGRISVKNRLSIKPNLSQTSTQYLAIQQLKTRAKQLPNTKRILNKNVLRFKNFNTSLVRRRSNINQAINMNFFRGKGNRVMNRGKFMKNNISQNIRNNRNIRNNSRNIRNNPVKKEQFKSGLDMELDTYMSASRFKLDNDLDSYMSQPNDNIIKTHM
ncbi:unnamed protein product [Gordionus sp. m RMFG-2023]|uniref:probable serine/threonine-protein kinase DDB_G0280133 n=1 Tax=Gordionus sp. m RMFG-2023 TaxID=3053472 RepID=UPI0030E330AF